MSKVSKINAFVGNHRFLSNFADSKIEYNGLNYLNAEAAFQAQKDLERSKEFTNLPPNQAKALGRKVSLRNDWESVKDDIMYDVLIAKFSQNESLRKNLLETGDAFLTEGNNWGDRYWGVCKGVGENKLGHLLMKCRESIRASQQPND